MSEKDPRRVTIRDVAAEAGVAMSTVSRALTTPGRVNADTQRRIAEIAHRLGYVARTADKAVHSGTVAVLVADVTNPFYFGLIRGAQRQLKAAGFTQLLMDTEEDPEAERDALATAANLCEGIVVSASRLSDRELTAFAATHPLVTINRTPRRVPHVLLDTPSGVSQAVEHLVSLGHRRLLYVSGPTSSWTNVQRWRAMKATATRLGATADCSTPFSPTMSSGAAAADAALNRRASACIVFNDLIAIGMTMRFRERGVHVPGDISIVGCDDILGADFCVPALTTVNAPIEQAGRLAVSLLQDILVRGGRVDRTGTVLPTHLVIRASTGPHRSP
ncbi:LacI family DNA-binding transcriptional regulator [Kutzneria sp. NPDC052558]|uniref:LacI family DNA-binding transcriptional regulator n=1 Tax=Kutzneria sp. NPDC052558 TaxID=3364121 RepID=UPI0037CA40B9